MFTFFCSPIFCSKKKKIRKNRSWHKCLKGVCSESASTVTNIDFYASLCALKCLFPPADLPLCIAPYSKIPSSRGRGGGEREKAKLCSSWCLLLLWSRGSCSGRYNRFNVRIQWWEQRSPIHRTWSSQRCSQQQWSPSEGVMKVFFWSQYFCTRQAESYRSGSGHYSGYKRGMNFLVGEEVVWTSSVRENVIRGPEWEVLVSFLSCWSWTGEGCEWPCFISV